MPTTEVILTANIRGLGAEADIVKVKRGFARNFLLPKGMAYEVNATALRRLNSLKAQRAEREGKERNEAEEIARRIAKVRLTMTLETGAQGKAFGSITARDLEEALRKELPGIALERHAIELERPIKTTGEQEISVRVHPEVTATLKVNVRPSVEPEASTSPAADNAAAADGSKAAPTKAVSSYSAKKKAAPPTTT